MTTAFAIDAEPAEQADEVHVRFLGTEVAPAASSLPDASGFDAESFGRELDAIRAEVLDSLGEADAAYIRRIIRTQRRLDLAGRALLTAGVLPPAWLAGVGLLSIAKILENMEVGHNVIHAQWDWMRDPEIHSTTWEWDNVCPASQWKHTHNHMHHQWTNVVGMDRDIGYGIFRVHASQPWKRYQLLQPAIFVGLAVLFEYGIGFHDLESDLQAGERLTWATAAPKVRETLGKIRSQALKDYVLFPALALPFGLPGVVAAATGAATANVVRNLWSFAVIFCGHFPDGVEVFPASSVEDETRGDWYRRQVLGSANFEGGPLMHLLSGNLDHQIEHHLFPDLPSNRYAEIGPEVRGICERHGLEYNTGSFAKQFGTVVRKVLRLSLPFG
jgi:linoleoyl-CoA desaturase